MTNACIHGTKAQVSVEELLRVIVEEGTSQLGTDGSTGLTQILPLEMGQDVHPNGRESMGMLLCDHVGSL